MPKPRPPTGLQVSVPCLPAESSQQQRPVTGGGHARDRAHLCPMVEDGIARRGWALCLQGEDDTTRMPERVDLRDGFLAEEASLRTRHGVGKTRLLGEVTLDPIDPE